MAEHAEATPQRIAEIVRNEWPRVVAVLVAGVGDLGEAEDAAQDAAEEALRQWPTTGLPAQPRAWLIVVARRRLIDRLRRNSLGRDKLPLAARLEEPRTATSDDEMDDLHDRSIMRDDQLRLIFACCHPALRPDAQIALTLRSVGGLSTHEIAAAFLLPEPTVAQRLVRAKKKIKAAAIPFKIPPDVELLARTDLVRSVLYLIFNEGYDASSGGEHVRTHLCDEAIRLAELLAELTPDDPETLGLHSLFLLIHARRDERVDDHGGLVLLDDQDRTRWDADMIRRGIDVLDRALRLNRSGPIQIQAAINALHAEAATAAETDWEQIELLYRRLATVTPTPVVRLNHAVALAMADGPEAALALLADASLADELAGYSHFHAARARLFADIGDRRAAATAYRTALAVCRNDAERAFLTARLAEATDP